MKTIKKAMAVLVLIVFVIQGAASCAFANEIAASAMHSKTTDDNALLMQTGGGAPGPVVKQLTADEKNTLIALEAANQHLLSHAAGEWHLSHYAVQLGLYGGIIGFVATTGTAAGALIGAGLGAVIGLAMELNEK